MAQTDNFRKYKSLYSSTAGSFGTGTGETITPASVTGLPTTTEITLTFDRVDGSGTATPTLMERITGTISGGNLTSYTRGIDGSTEQAHTSPVVEMIWNADDWNDAIDAILVEHAQAGTHTNITGTTLTLTGNVSASSVISDNLVASTANKPIAHGNGHLTTPAIYTPAGAATATLDVSNSNVHNITMPAGNITIAISNETVGQCFIVEILQDGTGSRTVTWFSTIKWAGGSASALTTTASKRDTFGFRVTGVDTYDGFVVGLNI